MVFQEEIVLKPIGFVKTQAVGDEVKDKTRTTEIILNGGLVEALDGVKDYSHLFILFWLNQISSRQRAILKVHPRGRSDLPLLGVLPHEPTIAQTPLD